MKSLYAFAFALLFTSLPAFSQYYIRSVMVNAPGGDNGNQFVEIAGPSNQSLNNYYLIEVEGDGNGNARGVVERVINLSSYTLGSKGLLLLRENASLAPAASSETTVITGNLPTIENGTVTLALVTGWSGTAGTSDIDANNDGVVDATFWTSVVSAVSTRDDNSQTNDRGYGAALGGSSLPDINGARYAGFLFTGVEYLAFELQSGESNPGPYTIGTAWNASGSTVAGFSGIDLTPGRNEYSFPVTLVSFEASLFNKNIQLRWKTATEKNSDRFEIQRSADGRNFVAIASVKAAGNSASITEYSFSEQALKGATLFYRLKMTDIDGSYQYSGIAKIKLSASGISINNIYPQPAYASINVEWNSVKETTARMSIVNLSGQRLINQSLKALKGYNLTSVNVSNLAKGIYIMSIDVDGERLLQKFQKQ